MAKKTERTRLKNKMEKLAKLVAKTRDGWLCQKCGKYVQGGQAHGSHVIPVSHGDILRFDPLNIKCLCKYHHMDWWHRNPLAATEWFKDKFPDRYEYIQERKNEVAKFTMEDLERMYEELQEQLE